MLRLAPLPLHRWYERPGSSVDTTVDILSSTMSLSKSFMSSIRTLSRAVLILMHVIAASYAAGQTRGPHPTTVAAASHTIAVSMSYTDLPSSPEPLWAPGAATLAALPANATTSIIPQFDMYDADVPDLCAASHTQQLYTHARCRQLLKSARLGKAPSMFSAAMPGCVSDVLATHAAQTMAQAIAILQASQHQGQAYQAPVLQAAPMLLAWQRFANAAPAAHGVLPPCLATLRAVCPMLGMGICPALAEALRARQVHPADRHPGALVQLQACLSSPAVAASWGIAGMQICAQLSSAWAKIWDPAGIGSTVPQSAAASRGAAQAGEHICALLRRHRPALAHHIEAHEWSLGPLLHTCATMLCVGALPLPSAQAQAWVLGCVSQEGWAGLASIMAGVLITLEPLLLQCFTSGQMQATVCGPWSGEQASNLVAMATSSPHTHSAVAFRLQPAALHFACTACECDPPALRDVCAAPAPYSPERLQTQQLPLDHSPDALQSAWQIVERMAMRLPPRDRSPAEPAERKAEEGDAAVDDAEAMVAGATPLVLEPERNAPVEQDGEAPSHVAPDAVQMGIDAILASSQLREPVPGQLASARPPQHGTPTGMLDWSLAELGAMSNLEAAPEFVLELMRTAVADSPGTAEGSLGAPDAYASPQHQAQDASSPAATSDDTEHAPAAATSSASSPSLASTPAVSAGTPLTSLSRELPGFESCSAELNPRMQAREAARSTARRTTSSALHAPPQSLSLFEMRASQTRRLTASSPFVRDSPMARGEAAGLAPSVGAGSICSSPLEPIAARRVSSQPLSPHMSEATDIAQRLQQSAAASSGAMPVHEPPAQLMQQLSLEAALRVANADTVQHASIADALNDAALVARVFGSPSEDASGRNAASARQRNSQGSPSMPQYRSPAPSRTPPAAQHVSSVQPVVVPAGALLGSSPGKVWSAESAAPSKAARHASASPSPASQARLPASTSTLHSPLYDVTSQQLFRARESASNKRDLRVPDEISRHRRETADARRGSTWLRYALSESGSQRALLQGFSADAPAAPSPCPAAAAEPHSSPQSEPPPAQVPARQQHAVFLSPQAYRSSSHAAARELRFMPAPAVPGGDQLAALVRQQYDQQRTALAGDQAEPNEPNLV